MNRWEQLQKESKYTFNEQELAGNLINKLKTREGTENILYILVRELNVQDSDMIIDEIELVDIFQSMRSSLIELYVKKADKDFEFWLET